MRLDQFISDEVVCRTAPVTPGLLNIGAPTTLHCSAMYRRVLRHAETPGSPHSSFPSPLLLQMGSWDCKCGPNEDYFIERVCMRTEVRNADIYSSSEQAIVAFNPCLIIMVLISESEQGQCKRLKLNVSVDFI